MIFSASATHALRALAHLAGSGAAGATLGRELADEIEVPSHYLAKVLATLARAGLLSASRGARGGYRLARPAERITLLEIVEPFEGKRVRPGCLLRPDRECSERAACSAHAAWSGVKRTYLGFLERTTLADIQAGALPLAPPRRPGRGRRPSSRTSTKRGR
jgi:Rrf2 family protein